MELYAHDPDLARRLHIAAHWRLMPKELKALTDDDIAIMDFSYRLYEFRNAELLTDLFGLMLGASWPANSFATEEDTKESFTWKLREKPARLSTPVTMVVGGEKFHKFVKEQTSKLQLAARSTPSVLNHPGKEWVRGEEIVELSFGDRAEFLKIAGRAIKD